MADRRTTLGNTKNDALKRFVETCGTAARALYDSQQDRGDCGAKALCGECVRQIIGMIAVLASSERISSSSSCFLPLKNAAQAISDSASGVEESSAVYFNSIRNLYEASGLGIFHSPTIAVSQEAFDKVARILLHPQPDAPIGLLFYPTLPLFWIGSAYQHLLTLRPGDDGQIETTRAGRKRNGVFYTPQCLVNYITHGVLAPLASESRNHIRLLDPSMGGGDFLVGAIDFLTGTSNKADRAEIAAKCVYGVDIDPLSVEISRFCVWSASGYAEGISDAINSHLACANALGCDEDSFDWQKAFPEVFDESDKAGFDAVVGNPPYIASKNGLRVSSAGQSDSYLMFLSTVFDKALVKPGGMLSMVLPDPMLVRENAAAVRRKLMSDWSIVSLLHISNVFPEASVANVIPICRNAVQGASSFTTSRIERAADRDSFNIRPSETALELASPISRKTILSQDRCEFLYLMENGDFANVLRRIHGDSLSLNHYNEPFAPLRSLNVNVVYRGEEVGKSSIQEEHGEFPMLLGGQSIRPYEIVWEGRRIERHLIRKSVSRYASTKILIQKSSDNLIAALDETSDEHKGYVFPQSVYGVELREPGMDEVYLLCLLNSQILNEYIWRTVTGYKFLQPQLEIEDIRALPIRRIDFITPNDEKLQAVESALQISNNEKNSPHNNGLFAGLRAFAKDCLTRSPEKSDVVHDVLVCLGREVIEITRSEKKNPNSQNTRRLESARAAIEIIVSLLYQY